MKSNAQSQVKNKAILFQVLKWFAQNTGPSLILLWQWVTPLDILFWLP